MPPPPGESVRPATPLPSGLHVASWEDVFVLVDYGTSRPTNYLALGDMVVADAARYPAGIGGLTIIPRNAVPPSEMARAAMRDALLRLGTSLRCFCWLVEGDGFQGAMVRGVLTGLRVFGRLPYESHVSSDLSEALTWVLQRLDGSDARVARVPEGVRWIEEKRRLSERERPPDAPPQDER